MKLAASLLLVVGFAHVQARTPFTALATLDDTNAGALALEPDAPWEKFIAPGPTVVSLLGHLMVLSSKVDFSLTKVEPKAGYKYIQFPDSFRATLVQITNDGWTAFSKAQRNMDKIQLLMQTVPMKVKTALRIIDKGSNRVIKSLLPKPLTHIGQMGKLCVDLAIETEDAFINVMQLIGEVIAATETARGLKSQQLKDVQEELNVTRAIQAQMKQYGAALKDRVKSLNQEVSGYRHAYEDAMKEIPTGWKAIAQDLGRTVVGVVKGVASMIGGGGGGSGSGGGGGGIFGKGGGILNLAESTILSTMNTFSSQLFTIKGKLGSIFKAGKVTSQDDPVAAFKSLGKSIKTIVSTVGGITGGAAALKDKAVSYLNEGEDMCKDIVGAFSDIAKFPSKDTAQKIEAKVSGLLNKVKPMTAAQAYNSRLGAPEQNFGGPNGDAKYKAYLAQRVLQDSEKRSDAVFKEYIEYQKQLGAVMSKLAHLNFEEINYEQVLELMREGIKLLSQIRQQWSKLVTFFSMVAVRSEVMLNETLVPFLEYSHEIQGMVDSPIDLSPDDREFFLELMVEQAKGIESTTYFLYTVSSTYVTVSQKYLVDKLAGLSQMLTAKTDQERTVLLARLSAEGTAANKAIETYARGRRESYQANVQKKIDEMAKTVQLLGGVTEEDKQAADDGLDLLGGGGIF